MATRTKKTPGTDIVDWEKEMEAQAALAAGAQRASGGGGKFFSLKAGILSFDGAPMPGNQALVVVLADIMENSWYDGPYDESRPASPKCFAFGKVEGEMEPHQAVDQDDYFERQSAECSECPHNQWGSAEVGRGKACKNVMRLSLISAGAYKSKGSGRNATVELDEVFDDPDHYASAEEAYIKLSVTSVKNYSAWVKQVAADLRRPPHGVIATMWVEPHPKSQFQVKFEVHDVLPNELLPVIMERHKKAQASIDFPYQRPQEDEAPQPAKTNNKLRGKTKR